MSERDFAKTVTDCVAAHGRKMLRVADRSEGRRGVYGLRAVGVDIASPGVDYLVLPERGLITLVASDTSVIRAFLTSRNEAFFLELKDPRAPKRYNEDEQRRWIHWVGGIR